MAEFLLTKSGNWKKSVSGAVEKSRNGDEVVCEDTDVANWVVRVITQNRPGRMEQLAVRADRDYLVKKGVLEVDPEQDGPAKPVYLLGKPKPEPAPVEPAPVEPAPVEPAPTDPAPEVEPAPEPTEG